MTGWGDVMFERSNDDLGKVESCPGDHNLFPPTFGQGNSILFLPTSSAIAPYGAELGCAFDCLGGGEEDVSLEGEPEPSLMALPRAVRSLGSSLAWPSLSDTSCIVISSLPRGPPIIGASIVESVPWSGI